jgi:DNA-binding XRE family transcriptional regulator
MSKPVYKSRIEELLRLKSQMLGEPLSAEDLAQHIGVTRQTIYNWMSEDGVNTMPSAPHQIKLETYFGVPWTQIWRLVNQEKMSEQSPPSFVGVLAHAS